MRKDLSALLMVGDRVQISAKKGDGVSDLLDTVLLMAEVEQLVANPARAARGSVIEAHLDRRQGAIAAVLVANGTLRVGDVVQAGATFGRVRHATLWVLLNRIPEKREGAKRTDEL